ncbi:hypothetical protein DCS_00355 [Drechmeria coniospora]|uniref:Mmc protein n=1 Tax=Drechmeria coniospora TaxID=98403 RepID=A0A151GQ31_DRECN|nr:hypothetical protein DCS_00355 [Drechmeria coniospora]KYK59225.1 hypothetical protein DCS_00355 [Drechmeria coniospora]ODA77971.1 hypothetical protein RJ55_06574 [Drechmeria coniospora]
MLSAQTLLVAAMAGFVAADANWPMATGGGRWPPNHNNTVVTRVVDKYETYCPEPTTVCIGTKTYTVTKATTLTITDCPCTITEECSTCRAHPTKAYNGAPAAAQVTSGSKAHDVDVPVVAGSDGRTVAYGLAVAIAGAAGYFIL